MNAPSLPPFRAAAAALAATAIVAACSGGAADRPVPRPEAFARIDVPDSTFRPVDSLGLRFEANAAAVTTAETRPQSDARWFTIAYPTLGATVYCTATPARTPAERREAEANRAERIALNIGDNPSEQISIESADGFSGLVYVTPAGSLTPVQFLAVGPDGWVVSGTATLRQAPPAARADSVRPVVDALRRDIIHALKTLSRNP